MKEDKIFKTPISDLIEGMSPVDQTNFIKKIIKLFRENPNHYNLGALVDNYIREVLNKD